MEIRAVAIINFAIYISAIQSDTVGIESYAIVLFMRLCEIA